MNPFPLVLAMLRRHAVVSVAFIVLIALAVGLGAAITAQERALRKGSARAADRFDLIVAAPGSQTDLLLKVVFLRPGSVELLEGEPLKRLMQESRAEFVAPIGFGNSYRGDPVVGTIAALVDHLAGGRLEGRVFAKENEAVIGAASPLSIGEVFHAAHGEAEGAGADHADEHPQDLVVVGRLPPTGSPWDRAVLLPIEHVWVVHGLGDGHGAAPNPDGLYSGGPVHRVGQPGDQTGATPAVLAGEAADPVRPIGPPFDLDSLPGIPAAVVKPESVAAAYGLRGAWRTSETMAFFPAEVLVELYALLGDVRTIMSALAIATQALLIVAILAGLLILMRLYRHRFAVLRALGASRGYIFAIAWTFSFVLIALGGLLGLGVAAALTGVVSDIFEKASGIALDASIGWGEVALAGAIALLGAFLAIIPAALLYRQPVVSALRDAA